MAMVQEMSPASADDFIRTAIHEAVHDLLCDTIKDLVHTEEVNSEIAMTNASMFAVDEHEIADLRTTQDECEARVIFSVGGDHNEDRVFSGDRIHGTAIATIRAADDPEAGFDVKYAEVSAEREVEAWEDEEPDEF